MYRMAHYFMKGIVLAISFFLFMQTLFTTVRISTDDGEKSFFVDGNPIGTGILMLVIMMLLFLVYRRKDTAIRMSRCMTIAMFVINPLFVLMAGNVPRADAYRCMDTAAQMIQGDMSAFALGKYMDKYPNQNGLVFFYYCLAKVFGTHNYILIQLLNAVLIGILYILVYKYIKKYEPQYAEMCMLCLYLFFPITLYTTFVYGTVIGLVFSIAAIICQQFFLRRNRYRYLVIASLLISCAVQFKSNYVIFFIGMVICLIAHSIESKQKKIFILGNVLILAVFLILGSTFTNLCLDRITDGASSKVKGIPSSAWIVMGMQESSLAPGWYNSYNNNVYKQNEYDYVRTKLQCEQDLKTEIEKKINNPKQTLIFFSKKIASQWCEPSYQGFWYNCVQLKSNIERSALYYDLVSLTGRLNRIIYLGLDVFQSLIYFGLILYIILDKRKKITENIGLIVFVGGFLFHIFWEAKSSYIFPYMVIAIPYSAAGIVQMFDYIIQFQTGNIDRKYMITSSLKKKSPLIALLMVMIVCWGAVKDFRITEDTEAWNDYYRLHRFVPEGTYDFQTASFNDNSITLSLLFHAEKNWMYELRDDNGTLEIDGIDLYEDDQFIEFMIERLEGGYCFRWCRFLDQVLTYDTEMQKLTLTTYDENNKNQIWYLE